MTESSRTFRIGGERSANLELKRFYGRHKIQVVESLEQDSGSRF